MKRKTKLFLSLSAISPVAIAATTISCTDNTGVTYKWNKANVYGVPIPKYAKDLKKYMTYTKNEEAVASVNAIVAANVINGVDANEKMKMLYSYLYWDNEEVPSDFQYILDASTLSKQESQLDVMQLLEEKTIKQANDEQNPDKFISLQMHDELLAKYNAAANNKKDSVKAEILETIKKYSRTLYVYIEARDKSGLSGEMTVKIDGFKKYEILTLEQYNKIVNNILVSQGTAYLSDEYTSGDTPLSNLDEKSIKDLNNAISWSDKIIKKYNVGVFAKNPLANFYYASTFDNGVTIEATDTAQEIALKRKNREDLAIQQANDLIYRKEKQQLKDLEKGTIKEPGYSDAQYVRTAVQKLLILAQSYLLERNSSGKENSWYHSEELKNIITAIMDDLAKNYFFEGQQQFVNWWFYEIGIPRDLTKLMVVLFKVYNDELTSTDKALASRYEAKLKSWTGGINYFLPNARYGGAAKTAILNFVPVTKKRLQTGANVIDNAKPILLANILGQNQDKINDAIEALYDNLFREFVNHLDGFYYDGSFIQHDNLPYTGSYGEVLFTGMADIVSYFKGTVLDLSEDRRFQKLYQFIELSLMPYMYKASISDGLNGRSIARDNYSDKQKGLNILGALTFFDDEYAPIAYRGKLRKFIKEQVGHFSAEDIDKIGGKYKVRSVFITRLKRYTDDYKNNKPNEYLADWTDNEAEVDAARAAIDWRYYETIYNSEYKQPSASAFNDKTKPNVSGGVDLALENNGMVFSKAQDRYVWKHTNENGVNDFMINIAFHGNKIGFTEATLGENVDSYYYTDGAVLLHTEANNEPYADNFYLTVDRDRIPGTSVFHATQFDDIDRFEFNKDIISKYGVNPERWKSDVPAEQAAIEQAKNAYNTMLKNLENKRKFIEESISLRTNHSYNNGILKDGLGFVKARVSNWNNSLATYKAYFMIDGQLIVVGNVDQNDKDAKRPTADGKGIFTNIEVRKLTKDGSRTDGNISLEKVKLNDNKYLQNYIIRDNISKETNAYMILTGKEENIEARKATNSKYAVIANDTLTLQKKPDKLSNDFVYLAMKHVDAASEKFAYSQIPNYDASKLDKYKKVLNNFEILTNNRDYIVARYTKGSEKYYFVSSFVEQIEARVRFGVDQEYKEKTEKGIDIDGIGKIHFFEPTTMVIKVKDDNSWEVVSSSDYSSKNSYVIFGADIEVQYGSKPDYSDAGVRKVTNPKIKYANIKDSAQVFASPELKGMRVDMYNSIADYNGEKHNVWFNVKVRQKGE